MLASRFSIRALFVGVTVCAAIFAIVGQAIRGHGWAIAFSVALASLFAIIAIHVLFFLTTMGLSLCTSLFVRRTPGAGSPFAQDRPPPQWVEPTEPES